MKTLLALILPLLIALAPPAMAADPQHQEKQHTQSEKPRKKSYKGRITAIDPAAGAITVRRVSSSKTFSVAADVPIRTIHKPKAALADLKRGDWVNIRFIPQPDGTNIATRINHAAEMEPLDGPDPKAPAAAR